MIWAVAGSTKTATRTTTLPRSYGPETAGVDDHEAEGSALVGTGEVDVAAGVERAGARRPRRDPDADLLAGQSGRGLLLRPWSRGRRQGRDAPSPGSRRLPEGREEALAACVTVERGQVLITVFAAQLRGRTE